MAYTGEQFTPDCVLVKYVVPVHPSNVIKDRITGEIKALNKPKVLVLHTPEEPWDNYESTPVYFSSADKDASTHYYQDSDGELYQLLPEVYGAIANGVLNKPYPAGTDPSISLNYQSLSIEIEGQAATIHTFCVRGSNQWIGLVRWIENRSRRYNIPLDRAHIICHKDVASNRSDPGLLDVNGLIADAIALRNSQQPIEDKDIMSYKLFTGPNGAFTFLCAYTAKTPSALEYAWSIHLQSQDEVRHWLNSIGQAAVIRLTHDDLAKATKHLI